MTRELRILRAILLFRRHRVRYGIRPIAYYWLPIVKNEGLMTVGSRLTMLGAEARIALETRNSATLRIGDGGLINAGATITCHQQVTIGDDVKIGSFVSISDSGSHEVVPGEGARVAPVTIGDNVWIGRGSFIGPGITIGDGAVVGAGSIVTRDVEAFSVVAGSPARLLRTLQPTTLIRE